VWEHLLSAVGLLAVDEDLVKVSGPVTIVSVRNVNTGKFFRVHVPVSEGKSVVQSNYRIAGVPKPGAYIQLDFIDPNCTSLNGGLCLR
jgi:2-methylaconitate cis-trans-isomerase PrpF